MKAPLAVLAICALVAGCAYHPIVDPKKTDMAKFETDLAECREIAKQAPGAGTGAAVGAVGGYALGQVVSRTTGHGGTANEAGRGAAVVGAAGGAGASARSQREVIRNCLKGRGHAVLN